MATNGWQKLRVLDGGFGSELETAGFQVSRNLRICRYLDAGCDVLLTNTYHANIATMKATRKLTDSEANAVVSKGVSLAHRAVVESNVEREIEIFGSVGPYATALSDGSEYNGHYVDEISEEVVFGFCFKTHHIIFLNPVSTILYMLYLQDEAQTNHCDSFSKAVAEVTKHPKVIAAGINCTNPSYISSLLRSASDYCNGKPFVVYPNSGEIYDTESRSWGQKCTKKTVPNYVEEWRQLGAGLIGGCCRVTPADVRAIADAVNKAK
ncbi:unnamed protein product [Toxocara canis]|uniref:Hcy-binding domain-containing protein n=1 Tax=Toxocara canis TaxID=6265 RepID=A0A183UHX3_TOXCA|nr:unnamed protein product [Toxocara canis]